MALDKMAKVKTWDSVLLFMLAFVALLLLASSCATTQRAVLCSIPEAPVIAASTLECLQEEETDGNDAGKFAVCISAAITSAVKPVVECVRAAAAVTNASVDRAAPGH